MYVSDTEGCFADLATPQESILMFETRRTYIIYSEVPVYFVLRENGALMCFAGAYMACLVFVRCVSSVVVKRGTIVRHRVFEPRCFIGFYTSL